jgi:adenosine deaminase
LHRLPKTDLHCHLGGVLDSKDLIDVASCYAEDIENEKAQNEKFREWADGFKQDIRKFKRPKSWKTWQKEVSKHLHVNPCLVNASLLLAFRGQEDLLEAINFGSLLSEQEYIGIGITRYEALGDLQGSALLQTEKSIRRTVQILLEKAERENIVYLEIRCSPFNYVYNGLSGQQVIRFICEELEKKPDIHTSLLLIASRHGKLEKIRHSIELMREMESDVLFKKYFRGFDLAGDESVCPPAKLRKEFEDILRDCRNITIHAGENAPVENIWEAVYLLNAERVGHGLTLKDNPDLLNKFLERRIGIEMCPSSNFQIVGFHDNYLPNTKKRKIYPLREYLDKELMVCINTDDPGISRTDMTNELLRAARLTENGLTLWEILQLIYNGLQLAFYPYSKKKEMIHDVETKLGQLIRDGQL